MKHYLFDALKISPVPLETANKVTEVGWLLEIERLLNKIIDNANGSMDKLETDFNSFLDDFRKEIEERVTDEGLKNAYLEEVTNRIRDTLDTMLGDSLKLISVELDQSGSIILNIPRAYETLTFDTDMDNDSKGYGCLTLDYKGGE